MTSKELMPEGPQGEVARLVEQLSCEATATALRSNIPQLLRSRRRWTTWKLTSVRGGRLTKKPAGSTLQESTRRPWSDVAGETLGPNGGVGFVMTGGVEIDGTNLISLDVDACIHSSGELSPWAEKILAHYQTYAEVSPSGTGLRLFLRVRTAPKAMPLIRVPAPAPDGVNKKPQIQVFGSGPAGYVTVTGARISGAPAEPETHDSLSWLEDHLGVKDGAASEPKLPTGQGEAPTLDEIEAQLKKDPKTSELIDGNWGAQNLESASEGFHLLTKAALRAAHRHGLEAVEFLLERTAYGTGTVDSRDPDRYAHESWVTTDVARTASQMAKSANVFDDGFNPEDWRPPLRRGQGQLLLQTAQFIAHVEQQPFLLKGLLPARGLAQIFGAPACGKTPFALSLAIHVAAGLDWFGHRLVRQGPVAYIIGEDPTGIRNRLIAELKALGLEERREDLPLYLSPAPAQLIDPKNCGEWVNAILAATEAKKASLIVVDTQSRNFGPGNESDNEDMAKFVFQCDRLIQGTGALVLLVHHSGHSNRSRGRGASTLPAALDAQFEIKKSQMFVTMSPTKSKNWSSPRPLAGTLTPVQVGHDDDGEPITAITLTPGEFDPEVFVEKEYEEPIITKLLGYLENRQKAATKLQDVANALGLSLSQAKRAVNKAEKLGLLRKNGTCRSRSYDVVRTP